MIVVLISQTVKSLNIEISICDLYSGGKKYENLFLNKEEIAYRYAVSRIERERNKIYIDTHLFVNLSETSKLGL